MIDLNQARLVHMAWLIEIEDSLIKGNVPNIESFQNCELGQWIYSYGMKKYSASSSMLELERKHKQFHKSANEMSEIFRKNNNLEAKVIIRELNRESRDLIFLLTRIEFDISTGMG